MKLQGLFWGLVFLAPLPAIATTTLGDAYNFRSLSFALQGGFGPFNSYSPGGDIRFNSGNLAGLEFEKGVGFDGLYVSGDIRYLVSSGSSNYNYQSPTALYITGPVGFSWEEYQLSMGLRYKFWETSDLQPFLGAGLCMGLATITYDNSLKSPAITTLGSDYRTVDPVMEFGHYLELGMNYYITHLLGLRLSYIFMENDTKAFDTLKKQMVRYEANLYSLSVFTHF